MKITAAQRSALEAAGYSVSKSGRTVQAKNGGTVGGYNENGNVFSGNKAVASILKDKSLMGEPKAAPKEAPKAKAKSAPKASEKSVAKDAMSGYRKGDVTTSSLDSTSKGRGDGAAEVKRRAKDSMVSGRGDGAAETKRRKDDSKPKDRGGLNVALPAAAVAAAKGKGASAGKPFNPNYKSGKAGMAEGFQGKYGGEVAQQGKSRVSSRIGSSAAGRIGSASTSKTPASGRVASASKPRIAAPAKALPPPETGFKGQTPEFMNKTRGKGKGKGRGAPGVNPGKVAKGVGTKGGRRPLKADDFNPFLN